MSVKIIQERLESYKCQSAQEEHNAIREITQEVILAALSRTDFFKVAGFQGGTCLRIFYSLNRFSEDLDFIAKKPAPAFSFDPYVKTLALELEAFGYRFEMTDRSAANDTVKKIFLKDDSLAKVFEFAHLRSNGLANKIRIKIEVDTNPPGGSGFENRFCDFPFVFSATLQDLPSLFAGKVHALLCRGYAKGRDWYDFIWYTARGTPINFDFLAAALDQLGSWQGQKPSVAMAWCLEALQARINSLDWNEVRQDVARFIKPAEAPSVNLWSRELFLDRLDNYKRKMVQGP